MSVHVVTIRAPDVATETTFPGDAGTPGSRMGVAVVKSEQSAALHARMRYWNVLFEGRPVSRYPTALAAGCATSTHASHTPAAFMRRCSSKFASSALASAHVRLMRVALTTAAARLAGAAGSPTGVTYALVTNEEQPPALHARTRYW
jgi:hypothetical protein